MHYTPLPDVDAEYPMTAIYRNTPQESTGPWALPGDYSLVLTVNGKSYTQPLTVKMDPRVKASPADLTEQFELSKKLYDIRARLEPIGKSFDALNEAITKAKESAGDQPVKQQLDAFTKNWRSSRRQTRGLARRSVSPRSITSNASSARFRMSMPRRPRV